MEKSIAGIIREINKMKNAFFKVKHTPKVHQNDEWKDNAYKLLKRKKVCQNYIALLSKQVKTLRQEQLMSGVKRVWEELEAIFGKKQSQDCRQPDNQVPDPEPEPEPEPKQDQVEFGRSNVPPNCTRFVKQGDQNLPLNRLFGGWRNRVFSVVSDDDGTVWVVYKDSNGDVRGKFLLGIIEEVTSGATLEIHCSTGRTYVLKGTADDIQKWGAYLDEQVTMRKSRETQKKVKQLQEALATSWN
jgi:hypothetical protein